MNKIGKVSIYEAPAVKSRLLLDIMASKWAVPVLAELSAGVKRYSEIDKAIVDIKQKSLTVTLRNLERNGMIRRLVYPIVPPRVEYGLTGLGGELLAIVKALDEWSQVHYCEIEQARVDYDSRDTRPLWMVPRDPSARMNG